MTSTIIQQGSFVSTGESVDLNIRSDVDFIDVENFTQMGTQQTPGRGVAFKWQRGMADGSAFETTKTDATDALQGETITAGGFTLLDTSKQIVGALNSTILAISTDPHPNVTTSAVHNLSNGDVVRIINVVGGQQLGNIDFSVDITSTQIFGLRYMSQIIAATTGSFRKIIIDPLFYPSNRIITEITNASQAVVALSVVHGYLVGQAIKFNVASTFGMVEIDGLIGNILSVDTANNTVTVDIDSTSFTPFVFPLTSDVPFSQAQTIPIGQTTNETFANSLTGATDNRSFIGINLGAGIDGPAGSSGDVIFWKGGKSTLITT